MPSHLSADRPAPPPEPGDLDALITSTRRLRGDVEAVRQDAGAADDDAHGRWRRALYDLAVHHLDDLGSHLDQLREDGPADAPLPREPAEDPLAPHAADRAARPGSLLSRVGSAEWNLLTDEVSWSEELFGILGRSPSDGPMSLDELPSVVAAEDQPLLTVMVTDCLVDGRPIDGEFRAVLADGRVRTLHMTGEPVLDADGSTAAMWAVLRDVSELRRSQRAVAESRDTLRRRQHAERTERRLAVEMQEAVLPPWRGPLRFPEEGPARVDVAAHYLPAADGGLIGGNWYDALQLPDGSLLLSTGDLTGHGAAATSSMAMLLGALRGMAVAGLRPGSLLGHLDTLLGAATQPALGSALCCRYEPGPRRLSWARAGHPAPLLFRDGGCRPLAAADGVLLGATGGAAYQEAGTVLEPGDVLVLHTEGLFPEAPAGGHGGALRLAASAAEVTAARDAQECVRLVVETARRGEHEGDACVLVARVTE
ncbi:PP2C family protein-serine/threonine phosphatase [Streptomyces sp. C10-9-1]|uniref:PP2C family protein-serine/threonine phosphatase n=1 Tax=Streptomyces sp. C10-9-1 TaxID=1859285 RepID=UPI003D722115